MPNSADLQEFIDNTEILSTETVSCEELGKNVKKITFRSMCNGKTITMLTNGYISNANVSQESYLDRRYLQPEDDIVQINWPDGWYIPTAQDLQLLVENTTVKDETINGNTWFRLTSTNGNSILIPGTGYIDDIDNVEKCATEAYLQSSTIGVYTSKPTIHALRVAKTGASLVNSAGRPTGLMVRPENMCE